MSGCLMTSSNGVAAVIWANDTMTLAMLAAAVVGKFRSSANNSSPLALPRTDLIWNQFRDNPSGASTEEASNFLAH